MDELENLSNSAQSLSSTKQETFLRELDSLAQNLLTISPSDNAAITNIAAGIQTMSQSLREVCTEQKRESEEASSQISDTSRSQSTDDETFIVPKSNTYIWIIDDYQRKLTSAEDLLSPVFYVSPVGYSMQCQLVFGDEDIGFGLCPVEGDFDKFLKWPFTVPIQVTLINQVGDSQHVFHVVTPNPDDETETDIWERPVEDQQNVMFHIDSFVKKSTVQGSGDRNISNFLRNNRLYIQVKLTEKEHAEEAMQSYVKTETSVPDTGLTAFQTLREDFFESLIDNIYLFAFDDFKRKVQIGGIYLSGSFYTAGIGYKMMFIIKIKDSFLGIFFKLLKSDYDNCLKWPLQRKIKFSIINQIDETADFVHLLTPNITGPCTKSWTRPEDNDQRNCFGSRRVIKTSFLCGGNDFVSDYLRNDRIIVKVELCDNFE